MASVLIDTFTKRVLYDPGQKKVLVERATGACCVGASCTIETEQHCIDISGVYQGDDTTCDPNPCGGDPCACLPEHMLQPFFNPDDGLYYSQRTDDCCELMSTYSGEVPSDSTFSFLNTSTTGCNDCTGSMTANYAIDPETCDIIEVSCSGSIFDGMGHCIQGNGPGCDSPCGQQSGCQPCTVNVQTLSGICPAPVCPTTTLEIQTTFSGTCSSSIKYTGGFTITPFVVTWTDNGTECEVCVLHSVDMDRECLIDSSTDSAGDNVTICIKYIKLSGATTFDITPSNSMKTGFGNIGLGACSACTGGFTDQTETGAITGTFNFSYTVDGVTWSVQITLS